MHSSNSWTNTIGQITVGIVVIVSLATEAFTLDPQAIARIFLGGWNGMTGSGDAVEGIVCNNAGQNCRFQGGDSD